jgi:hypothetical protein
MKWSTASSWLIRRIVEDIAPARCFLNKTRIIVNGNNNSSAYIPYPIELGCANFRIVAKSSLVKRLGRKNEIRKRIPEIDNNVLFVVVKVPLPCG